MSKNIANTFESNKNDNQISTIEQTKAVRELETLCLFAKRFPRNEAACVDNILKSCTRESLASSALYTYKRGTSMVTGPSIRLAEALAVGWQNIATGMNVTATNENTSNVYCFARDLQTMYQDNREFEVRHWRDTKAGGYLLTDQRDIYELVANMGSRRKRACILAVIPGDVLELAQRQCEVTLANMMQTDKETIDNMVNAFKVNHEVSAELIEKYLGHKISAITSNELVNLRKIFVSIKDGISKPNSWFDIQEPLEENEHKVSDLQAGFNANKSETAKTQEPNQTDASPASITLQVKLDRARSIEECEELRKDKLIGKLKKSELATFNEMIEIRIEEFGSE